MHGFVSFKKNNINLLHTHPNGGYGFMEKNGSGIMRKKDFGIKR